MAGAHTTPTAAGGVGGSGSEQTGSDNGGYECLARWVWPPRGTWVCGEKD